MKKIEKPWGSEEILEMNSVYMVKRLTMKAGHRCSLQYHNKKCETIYVLSGDLRIYIGDSPESVHARIYVGGEYVTISSGQVHRMEAVTDSIYLESSLPDDGNDVVRLSDDYERAK